MTLFLIITSLTVSIDSFICGFSLSLVSKRKLPIILGVTLTVFLMCLIANLTFSTILDCYQNLACILGGIILIGLGTYNLLKQDNEHPQTSGIVKQSIITGFAVGLDGAIASISLAFMGYDTILVPVIIGAMHGITISISTLISNIKTRTRIEKLYVISPLILILLGVYKIVETFI